MSYSFSIWRGWSRYLRRQRLQTVVSVLGLTMGMTCFALSALWLRYIESFEDFVPDHERVYVAGAVRSNMGNGMPSYNSNSELSRFVCDDYPEVEAAAGVNDCGEGTLSAVDADGAPAAGIKAKWAIGDAAFLDIFGAKFLQGSSRELNEDELCAKMHKPKDDTHAWLITFVDDLLPITKLRTAYVRNPDLVRYSYVRIFALFGMVVTVCALFNYIVTLIANMQLRRRTMALHALLGASRLRIVAFNAADTAIVFIISSVLGVALTWLVLPAFRFYSGIEISGRAVMADALAYLGIITAIGIGASVCATLAMVKPMGCAVLKGHASHRSSSALDRVSCIVQLALSLLVVICISVMLMQVRHLAFSNSLGFQRHGIVNIVPCAPDVKQRVLASQLVEASIEDREPLYPVRVGRGRHVWPDEASLGDQERRIRLSQQLIDDGVADFWGLKLAQGRWPQPGNNEALINEAAVKALGWDTYEGRKLYLDKSGSSCLNVVGVLSDMYIISPTAPVSPFVYTHVADNDMDVYPYILSVKLREGKKDEFLAQANEWIAEANENFVDSEEFSFLPPSLKLTGEPEDVEALYDKKLHSERILIKLLLAITVVCLVVSVMGLYSIMSLALQERRKEIALRKIHGARTGVIAKMFLMSNMLSLAWSALLAVPISIILMQHWLEAYPAPIAYPWWVPIAAIAMLAAIITITVARKINKATKANPTEAIKN